MKRCFSIVAQVIIVSICACIIVSPIVALLEYGDGSYYKVQFNELTSEECLYATTDTRDFNFIEVISEIDPCTLETVYWYKYQITWKTDAEGWLLSYLDKEGIEVIKIEESSLG